MTSQCWTCLSIPDDGVTYDQGCLWTFWSWSCKIRSGGSESPAPGRQGDRWCSSFPSAGWTPVNENPWYGTDLGLGFGSSPGPEGSSQLRDSGRTWTSDLRSAIFDSRAVRRGEWWHWRGCNCIVICWSKLVIRNPRTAKFKSRCTMTKF